MPISCEAKDREYFEIVCKKRSITKRELIHELIDLYKEKKSEPKKQKKN